MVKWQPASIASLLMVAAAVPATFAGAASPRLGPTQAGFAARLVSAQNAEREPLGLSGLRWDPNLAAAAASYAAELAATDKWEHSPAEQRVGQGENLWMGTRSAFTLEQMVEGWTAEKAAFRPGVFPNVSTTGRLEDVGHYTQIIWPQTVRVGCALRSSADYDYLVCRYSEPGNILGQPLHGLALASN